MELAEKESKRLLDRKLLKFIKMSVLSKTGIFLLKFFMKTYKIVDVLGVWKIIGHSKS